MTMPEVRLETQKAASRGLVRSDFRSVATRGWGDGYNSYAHSMAWFQDRLYVGAARANLHLIRRRKPAPLWNPYPVDCPDDPFTLDLRARIRRFDPRGNTWETVHVSPIVNGRNGREVPSEIGYRGMIVFQGPRDDAPALYVSSFCPTAGPGPMVFRSEDGIRFDPVSEPGFGYPGISAFRALIPYKGRLFTSPVGATQNRPNQSTYPMVFESADPAGGRWRPVSLPGFGNPDNVAVFEIAAWNGHLYAGTGNIRTGFEIWKTDAEGEPPYRWTQVLRLGAYRGNLNEGVLSLCVFNDALYVGTAIQDGGYDRANRIGPAAGEVIRVHPDDSWDLLVGASRLTPVGMKPSLSNLIPGFNNFFNGYIWRMCAHDGWLYVGTLDWSTFLPYAAIDRWPAPIQELIRTWGVEETAELEGGFDLLRSRDGKEWFAVTRTGFDNRYNIGVRTMVSTPYGLALGTVNPFGPDVATMRSGRWEYAPNDRGGLEVWLGKPATTPAPQDEKVLPWGQAPAEIGLERPVRRREYAHDTSTFELDVSELKRLRKRINVQSVRPDYISLVHKYHHLSCAGTENLPADGPVLIACNHVGSAVGAETSLMVEDVVLAAHVLDARLERPARILVDLGFYDDPRIAKLCQKTNEALGCVPITIGNGVRLLQMGEAVVIYPEGRLSSPDYRTRPFFWGFAKMAWLAKAPIVPAALIGPNESRPRVEIQGKEVVLSSLKPLPVKYAYTFLPPIDVRDHVKSLDDRDALRRFSDMVRGLIQDVLDREAASRPLVLQARMMQETYGSLEIHP